MRVLGATLGLLVFSACGTRGVCTPTSCAPGSVCDPQQLICVEAAIDAGRGRDAGVQVDAGVVIDGGVTVDAGVSVCGACALSTPVCDEANRRCVRCTSTTGCFGDTPTCDLAFQGGLGKCEVCVGDGGGCGGSTPVCDTVRSRCVGCLRHMTASAAFATSRPRRASSRAPMVACCSTRARRRSTQASSSPMVVARCAPARAMVASCRASWSAPRASRALATSAS